MVMLKAMRRRARRILWITIILIIPAFILWGTGEFRRRGINLVASVNGKGITREAYYKELQRLYREMRERMGDKFDERMAKILNLEEMAVENLIRRELLLQEAKREKIRISDEELREKLKSFPAFQRKGRFDKEVYFNVLEYLGYAPEKFEEEVKKDLTIAKLEENVLEKVKISEKEIRDEYLKENEEIEMEYLLIKPAKGIKIKEKEIERYYQENKEDYRVPEKIKMRHILIKEERKEALEKIKGIKRRLKKGEDFGKLAKEFSQCPSKEKGGDLGFIKKGDMIPEFEKVAFRLKVGQLSHPVITRFGYHLIKLEKRKESYIPPLDEVKKKIKGGLEEEKGWQMAKEKAQEIRKEIEKEELGALAKRFSLEVKGTGLFKRGRSNLSRKIEEEACGLKEGEVKGPLRERDGYYIIKLIKRKGRDAERFAEEKETFTKDFTQKKRALAYNQWYQELYQKAKIKIYPVGD